MAEVPILLFSIMALFVLGFAGLVMHHGYRAKLSWKPFCLKLLPPKVPETLELPTILVAKSEAEAAHLKALTTESSTTTHAGSRVRRR